MTNQYLLEKYQRAAKEIALRWSSDPNVMGVVGLGGLANKRVDRYSDLDLAVFIRSKKRNRIRVGEYVCFGCPLDVLLFTYPDAFARNWDDIQRDAFSNCVVYADKTGQLADLIRNKVRLTQNETRERVATRIIHLAWLGIYSKDLARKQSKTYNWDFPADLLAARGELLGAHGLLQRCTDLVVQLLFAVNERPVPDYKWRFTRVCQLPWIPRNFSGWLSEALIVKALTYPELRRRIRALRRLVEKIVAHAETRGFVPRRLYPYFLRHSSDYEVF